jgi:hypothetical protein
VAEQLARDDHASHDRGIEVCILDQSAERLFADAGKETGHEPHVRSRHLRMHLAQIARANADVRIADHHEIARCGGEHRPQVADLWIDAAPPFVDDDPRRHVRELPHQPPHQLEHRIVLALDAKNDLVMRIVLLKEGAQIGFDAVIDTSHRFEHRYRLGPDARLGRCREGTFT